MRPLTDVSPDAMGRAVEENEAEFLLAMGRAGGGHERDDAEITWNIGGSPIGYHNCVVRADLTRERADAAIVESQELMQELRMPGSWHVGPSMRPADLGERLRAHGFQRGPEPGMAIALHEIASVEEPPGFELERVASAGQLASYEDVLGRSFGEGPPEAEWVCAIYGKIGLDDAVPWRHYVGRLDGQPVATASMFHGAGVAGLYFVATLPEMRRRGIGAAISRSALVAAQNEGFTIGVLGSSPMGQRVYERLGFATVCDVDVYEWSPL